MSDITKHEPMPVETDRSRDVEPVLIDLVKERSAEGRRRYGTSLKTHNGRNASMDALQEAIDLCQYLTQEMMQRDDEVQEARKQINRRVEIEQLLLNAGSGKSPMPDAETLRLWGLALGTPKEVWTDEMKASVKQ